jgi:catechol 2,3-dioxygenase-like lactoylglutathione lyase family enzyme
MITGAHVILFSRDAEADRAFIRDVLGFAHVDAGGGWLIFKLPPAEAAVHPEDEGQPRHELYLMCNDLAATLAQLRARGVRVSEEANQPRWGLLGSVTLPSGAQLGIYEPRHPVAHSL